MYLLTYNIAETGKKSYGVVDEFLLRITLWRSYSVCRTLTKDR